MAPIDRREHRRERARGAGTVPVQATFGFTIGALPARPAKQTSLPPRPTPRRTPVQNTPRGAHGSAHRHRSASLQRGGSRKQSTTPRTTAVTPQLGKRKRGSTQAQATEDDGQPDELSPEGEARVASIEKSRRVAGTISPIHEEADSGPDELSFVEEGTVHIPKVQEKDVSKPSDDTPVRAPHMSSGSGKEKTPIAGRIASMSVSSRQEIVRSSKSNEPASNTPITLLNSRPRVSSASHFGPDFTTPGALPDREDGSEDELSSPTASLNAKIVGQSEKHTEQEDNVMDIDELSSPAQSPDINQPQSQPPPKSAKQRQKLKGLQISDPQNFKRGRPRKQDEASTQEVQTDAPQTAASAPLYQAEQQEDEVSSARPLKRGRPQRVIEDEEDEVQQTPAASKPRRSSQSVGAEDAEADSEPDEISPEASRTTQRPPTSQPRSREEANVLSDKDLEYNEQEEDPTPRPNRRAPLQNMQKSKPSSSTITRKRHKPSGPRQAISVMRIKGSTVRGITVADTTRTIVEENIDHRLSRLAEKMQNAEDGARRKSLRAEIMLSLSFKESLNEKLLDLQDANDVLSSNFRKARIFKRANAELRRNILTCQNSRHEVALELDEVQAEFDAGKANVEARNKLSKDMFDIQAAVENGREQAKKEGREDEGPEVPLGVLLETVGRDVGPFGGGLLASLKRFNGALERAAGWLEGRA